MYVQFSLQNRFGSLISLFVMPTILNIRTGEHAHNVGIVATSNIERKKQMAIASEKEFDMLELWVSYF